MNLYHWPFHFSGAWQAHPEWWRMALAVAAYLLVVMLMGLAASLIASDMPFFELLTSI